MYNKGLFQKWVPKPVMLLLIVVLLLPVLGLSGVYTGNTAEMTGSLGTMSEMVSFANYAGTIGMAMTFPLLLRLKRYFRSKELMVGSLLLMALLSWVCGTTEIPEVLIVACLLLGAVKMVAMIELIIPVMFIISPTGDRGRFYSVFYPVSIGLGQLSAYLSTAFAYEHQWRAVYPVSVAVLLFCALLCIVFMHNLRPGRQLPLAGIDWASIFLFGATLLLLTYALTFARQQAWFASDSIRLATIGFFVLGGYFIYRQATVSNPIIPLAVFKKKNVARGVILTLLGGLFLAMASLQSVLTSIFGYDAPTNALLNLAMLPGVVVAGVIAYFWFRHRWSIKGYILMGFASFALYAVLMYFRVASVIDPELLIIPSFFRGLGMAMMFIGVNLYATDGLAMMEMMGAATVLVTIRSFIGPALFGAVLSWAQYKLQWQHAGDMAAHMDAIDPLSAARGTGLALYGSLQTGAILATVKTLFGYIAMAGIGTLTYIVLLRFAPLHRRRMVLTSRLVGGESNKGYQLRPKNLEREELADAMAAAV